MSGHSGIPVDNSRGLSVAAYSAKQRNNAIRQEIVSSAHTISPRESSDLLVASFINRTLLIGVDVLNHQGRPARDAGLPSRLAASTRAALRLNRGIDLLIFLFENLLRRGLQDVVGEEELAIGRHHHHLNPV